MAKPDSQWYRLDNAGILYSALQREEYSAIYRFSALMTEPVRPAALQNAIDRVLPRFPSFAVRIRRGLFWYYLEPNTAPGPFLKADVANPCQPVRFREDNGWLVRFYYYRNRISLEVFHALSDGAGALIFFRTLLAEYLRQTGISVPAGNGVLDLEEPPRKEELEDAYARYAGRHALGLRRMPKAYANTGTPEPFYTFHVTMGFVPLGKRRYWVLPVDVTGRDAAEAVEAALSAGAEGDLCRVLLRGESSGADLDALRRRFSGRRAYLEIRNETTLPQDLWRRAEEDSLRGLFLRRLRGQLETAETEAERETIRQAARFGLAALEGWDLG